MGRKIYNRFEILKQVAGSPGNIVYKTQDLGPGGSIHDSPGDDSIVQLLEWTPAPSAFADSAMKLIGARDDVPEVEVFSSGPSLYIASPSAMAALAALRKLQSKGLFPGQWPGADSPMSKEEWENYWALQKDILELQDAGAIPLPTPIEEVSKEGTVPLVGGFPPPPKPLAPPKPSGPPKPVPQPEPPRPLKNEVARPPRWLTALIVVIALLLAVGIGLAWNERSRRITEQRQAELQNARLAELERQRQEQQRKMDETKAAAEKQQKALEERLRQSEIQHRIDLANERKQTEEVENRLRQQQERERRRIEAAKAEKERQDRDARERRRIEIAKAQQAQKRKDDLERQQEQERVDRQNAKAITDSFAQRQTDLAAGLSNQYHRIRLINRCDSSTINVAIRFQALDQTWVTQGWWQLEPHQEKPAPLVYSQNASFYFYAESGDNVWGGDSNSATIEVVENAFTHMLGPIVGRNRRVVKAIRRDFPTGYGEHPVPFNCH